MRVLYVALDQTVPGALGGSVHVESVAVGLARVVDTRCMSPPNPARRLRPRGSSGTPWARLPASPRSDGRAPAR